MTTTKSKRISRKFRLSHITGTTRFPVENPGSVLNTWIPGRWDRVQTRPLCGR